MKKERIVKWMQYLMLLFLFGMAFLLPIYAVRYQKQQSAERESASDDRDNRNPASLAADEENLVPEQQTDGAAQEMGAWLGTIVLDPGHGGFDPGMSGSSGITERELNLVYVEKLADLLKQEGYRVVLTRRTQEGLYEEGEPNKKAQDMQKRCAIIEEESPLLTVSIHQNSYPDAAVCGPQVFYYEHSAEGKALATLIQECMNEQLEISRPRVQKGNASYYILKHSQSVTVLVEVGFLSNPQEEEKLQMENYQDQAVQAICSGILQYLEKNQV